MAHTREELLATLEELRQQLADSEGLDPAARERLESVVAEVQASLDASPSEPRPAKDEEPSLIDQLTESARHFEETHPTLVGTIGSVIDALSRMGI